MKKRSLGFTLVEISIAAALTFLSVALMVKVLPMFIVSSAHRIDENNLMSVHALMDVVRSDLSQSNAGSVIDDRPASLYVCAYNAEGVCIPVNAQTPMTQNFEQKYCVASSSAGDLLGHNRQVNRFVMYRGKGSSFEYFQAQNNINDFADTDHANESDDSQAGTVIHRLLKGLCDAGYNQTPAGLRNGSWVKLNNERNLPLKSFMACQVRNGSFSELLSNAPPKQCFPPVNQLGRDDVDCRPGENGLNSLVLHYSFERRAGATPDQQSPAQAGPLFRDIVLVTFPGKPCILR